MSGNVLDAGDAAVLGKTRYCPGTNVLVGNGGQTIVKETNKQEHH